jgi:hypothetical protein
VFCKCGVLYYSVTANHEARFGDGVEAAGDNMGVVTLAP